MQELTVKMEKWKWKVCSAVCDLKKVREKDAAEGL